MVDRLGAPPRAVLGGYGIRLELGSLEGFFLEEVKRHPPGELRRADLAKQPPDERVAEILR
jgi:hypothetical protein